MSFRGLYIHACDSVQVAPVFCGTYAAACWHHARLATLPLQTPQQVPTGRSVAVGGCGAFVRGADRSNSIPSVAVLVLHRRLLGRLRINLNRSHGAQRRKRDGLQAAHGFKAHGCEAHGCEAHGCEAGTRGRGAGKQRWNRSLSRQQTRQTRGLQADPSPAVSASARDTAGQHACCRRLPAPASPALLAALPAIYTRRAHLGHTRGRG